MDNIQIKSNLYNYEVEFSSNFTQTLSQYKDNCTYVIDKNVYELYKESFSQIDIGNIYLIDAVESKKNIDTVLDLISFWKAKGLQKNWKVICLGGGISQDIATFASNIYLRNIDWYFFPTTLLAMCDSCIGGKCGINLGAYKNQLGVFYPPKRIVIDTAFLHTLSSDDYVNGWGEILKFSLTTDPAFYEGLATLKQYIPCEDINEFIHKGLMVKKNIIEQDEFEGDLRRVLNYGHTFGHALESYTKNAIPHGRAVIWGIDVVNYIAFREGILDKGIYQNVKDLIKKAFIPEEIKIENPEEIIQILSTDKKVRNNVVYLVLMNKLSNLIIYPKEIHSNLTELLKDYLEETHAYYHH